MRLRKFRQDKIPTLLKTFELLLFSLKKVKTRMQVGHAQHALRLGIPLFFRKMGPTCNHACMILLKKKRENSSFPLFSPPFLIRLYLCQSESRREGAHSPAVPRCPHSLLARYTNWRKWRKVVDAPPDSGCNNWVFCRCPLQFAL